MGVRIREGLVVLMGVASTVAGIAMMRDGTASSAENGVIALDPPSQVATVGERVTVDVVVSNAADLAAWEVAIAFDANILSFETFVEGPFLASTGRSVSCLAPVVHSSGAVQMGCASSGFTPPGPAGGGTVATITFSAKGTGTTALELTKAELANSNGDSCCGVVVTREAAVRVVATQSEEDDAPPPPTPTPNPRKLTPTPVNATPAPSLVLTPAAGGGEPPAGTGGVAGAVEPPPGARAGGGADDLFRSASEATAAGERNAPRAGGGALRTRPVGVTGLVLAILGSTGVTMTLLSALRRAMGGQRL